MADQAPTVTRADRDRVLDQLEKDLAHTPRCCCNDCTRDGSQLAALRSLRAEVAELEAALGKDASPLYGGKVIDALRSQEAREFGEKLRKKAEKVYALLMQHRERYIRAWCAATGVYPTDAKLVERDNGDGSKTVTIEPRDTVPVPTGELELLRAKARCLDTQNAAWGCQCHGHPLCAPCLAHDAAFTALLALEQKAGEP